MKKIKTRITQLTVLPEGEPIFSEQATHIRIIDEAAGEFVEIEQMNDQEGKKLWIEPYDWTHIKKAVDKLFAEIKNNEEKVGDTNDE